jgi:hypothetical protein
MKIDRLTIWGMVYISMGVCFGISVSHYFGELLIFSLWFYPSFIVPILLIFVLSLDKVLKRDYNQRGFLREDKKP